jgi:hypothetical protein
VTRRQVIGGLVAVASVCGFLLLVVVTNGWAFFAAILVLAVLAVFGAGAAVAGR